MSEDKNKENKTKLHIIMSWKKNGIHWMVQWRMRIARNDWDEAFVCVFVLKNPKAN